MAQFIQKFASMEDYNAEEHQYPNISLVEGEGLIWTAEAEMNYDISISIGDKSYLECSVFSNESADRETSTFDHPEWREGLNNLWSYLSSGSRLVDDNYTITYTNSKGDIETANFAHDFADVSGKKSAADYSQYRFGIIPKGFNQGDYILTVEVASGKSGDYDFNVNFLNGSRDITQFSTFFAFAPSR